MLALFLAETRRHQLQEAKSNRRIRVSLAKRWEPPSPTNSQETNIPPSPPRFRPSGGPISHLRYLSAPLVNALVRPFTRRRSIANTMASDILIVDDEPDIRELVAGILQDEGHGTGRVMHSAPPSWPSGWRLALQSKHPIPRRTRAIGSRCTPLRAALGRPGAVAGGC